MSGTASAAGSDVAFALITSRMDGRSSRSLAHAISRAVSDGALGDGDRLPSIRAMAAALGMSPTTVSAAWSLLARAGTIRTDGRRGTVIANRTTTPARYRRALRQVSGSPFRLDLSSGVPDPALLPDLAPALHRLHGRPPLTSYLDQPTLPALRDVLAASWPYPPDDLVVTDGAMDALDLFVRTHLRYGDRVAIEQPSFPPLLDLLELAGVDLLAVDLDASGPVPASLRDALDAGARTFFYQPRAHNPTGVSVTEARGRDLSRVLAGRDVLVVEDDSAGVIAAAGPISLGRWLPERTVHVRSFSKSHGPDLRLAAVSAPKPVLEPMAQRRFLGQGWSSRLLQALLHDLLVHPESVAQVEHARREYERRRVAVVAGLRARGVDVGGTDGLNVWVPVVDEAAAMVGLAAEGIRVAAGGPFTTAPGEPHLRVTAGLLAAGHDELAEQLARAAGTGSWRVPT